MIEPWPKCEHATAPRDFHISGRLKVVRGCRLIAVILSEGADTIPKGFENFLSPAMCACCPYLAAEKRAEALEQVGRMLLDELLQQLRLTPTGPTWELPSPALAAARALGLDKEQK